MEIQKIFSEINTNEKLYSVLMNENELALYSEYQKEFGVFQDIANSGFKRTYKKYGGRARKAAAEKLNKKALEHFKEAKRAEASMYNDYISKISPETVNRSKKLAGEKAKTYKARINDFGPDTPSMCMSNEDLRIIPENVLISRDPSRADKKFLKEINSGRIDHQIFYNKKNPVMDLVHEIGHIGNKVEGNRFQKKISSVSKSRRAHYNSLLNKRESGLKNALNQLFENELILRDEKNASRRGLNIMKEAGATPKELEEAKKYLKTAGKSYEHGGKHHFLSTLGNTINIPSRRKIYSSL